MASLAPLLDLLPDERVRALLDARAPVTVPEPVRPFLLASVARHLGAPVLAVVARSEEAESLARDIQAFLGRDGAEVFPGWEVLPGEPISPSTLREQDRGPNIETGSGHPSSLPARGPQRRR